jgi:hypothetical protein
MAGTQIRELFSNNSCYSCLCDAPCIRFLLTSAVMQMTFEERHFRELYPPADIVYLTAESDTVLMELDAQKVYIIGGLVDHNAHKGYCHAHATAAGLATARLPIVEFMTAKEMTRRVITVNQGIFKSHMHWFFCVSCSVVSSHFLIVAK